MNKKRFVRRAGLAAALSVGAATVSATPCDSVLSSYEWYVSYGYTSNAEEIVSNHPECFGGSQASSRTQINATSFVQVNAISNALAMRQPAGGPAPRAEAGVRGMAAGNGAGRWNVWGNLSNNDTNQSYTAANGFKAKNKADIVTTVFGLDYGLSPTVVLGVSAAFDDGDGSGRNAAAAVTNTIQTDGYLIAPYVGWEIDKNLSFDASAGLGRGRMETSGNTDASASRWFAAANLNYTRWVGNLQFAGRASYLHAVEDYGDIRNSATGAKFVGTDAKNTLGQLRLGAQIGYWMNGVMPYAGLAYANDVRRKTTQFGAPSNPIGRDGWLWSLGVNFYSLKDKVTGGVAYSQEAGRGNQVFRGLVANINLRF
ncbi:MAG: autotransporter outer membrane beta-barrel domain-containing protein [Rhodocyclaceae bacterium]|nr:autotransporter outer membrane beta-barrel domain-containing protein [Rhodocyclaceae bacterium]